MTMNLRNSLNNFEYKVYSVEQIVSEINAVLEINYSSIYVRGEVVDLTKPSSGHYYFRLRQGSSYISCAMFKFNTMSMDFVLEAGLEVVIEGGLNVYAGNSNFQLKARKITLAGDGALEAKFNKLKAKLQAAGYFNADHKKELPSFYRHVGLVTSRDGVAKHDIESTANNKFPISFYLAHTAVSGSKAAAEIAAVITELDGKAKELKLDAIIIARGGGSKEELWAFNEEVVVKAIYHAKTPIISAIGHEVDVSLSDLVADWRVATPTAAGEFITPRRLTDILQDFDRARIVLDKSLNTKLISSQSQVKSLQNELSARAERNLEIKIAALSSLKLGYSLTRLNKVELIKLQLTNFTEKFDGQLEGLLAKLRTRQSDSKILFEGLVINRANKLKNELLQLQFRVNLKSLLDRLEAAQEKIRTQKRNFNSCIQTLFAQKKSKIELFNAILEKSNHQSNLKRGYSVVTQDGRLISRAKALRPSAEITTTFYDGVLTSTPGKIEIKDK